MTFSDSFPVPHYERGFSNQIRNFAMRYALCALRSALNTDNIGNNRKNAIDNYNQYY
jgi:hypothetical protein